MDPLTERELADLAKPYSVLRAGSTKWASVRLQSRLKSGLPYEVQDLDGQVVGLVCREEEGWVYGYKIEALRIRLALKRSQVVFLGIYTVWKLINPFAIRGITKTLYVDLLLALYRSVFSISEDYPNLSQLVSDDASLDFCSHCGLIFSDFYHSVFHCVDSFTKSKLASEYVRAFNKLAETISTSTWLDAKDLHSKVHLTTPLPRVYEAWMRPILQEFHAPNIASGAAVARREENHTVASETQSGSRPLQRLFSAPVTKPRELPLARTYLRHIEVLLQEGRKAKQRKKAESGEGYMSSRVSPMKYSIRFRNLKHLSVISPLSKVSRRPKKDTKVLEDVLHKRSRDSLSRFTPMQTARF